MATVAKNFLINLDPFLLFLIGVVGAASLWPAHGATAAGVENVADLAIALLFFLHGAKLSRTAIVQGAGNWRLHLMVLASTYIWFPLLGWLLATLAFGWLDPLLLTGLLFLTLLPSTVQSSIAFTAIAGGNVAAAVCSASLSNMLGIFLTPLLAGLFMHMGGEGGLSSWHSIRGIALQLLVPFLAGRLLRPLIGGFVDSHKTILQRVDRGSILLVVCAPMQRTGSIMSTASSKRPSRRSCCATRMSVIQPIMISIIRACWTIPPRSTGSRRFSSSKNQPLSWIAGAYYYKDTLSLYQAFNLPIFGNPVGAVSIQNNSENYAAFADATYQVTEKLNFRGGLRLTHDGRSTTQFSPDDKRLAVLPGLEAEDGGRLTHGL